MLYKKIMITLWLFVSCSSFAERIMTIYGSFEIAEPVLCALLQSQAINRLRYIHQYGVDQFIHSTQQPYTRYIHSLGVLALLRKFGATEREQIAGLLHDASHTVFSHVGDHVYAHMKKRSINQNDEAYQDNMHLWFLAQTDVAVILDHFNIPLTSINHKNGMFHMLERDLPDICADRLEYNLYGAYIEGWLDENEILRIIETLHYEDNQWFFDNAHQARKFAEVSIRLCEEIFASEWNIGSYEWAAKALLRAVNVNLISMHDIHFGTDDKVWHILCQSQDVEIKEAVHSITHAKTLYEKGDDRQYDLCYVSKFRGVDPLVKTEIGLQRLTDIDYSFAVLFNAAKRRISHMRYYKYRA